MGYNSEPLYACTERLVVEMGTSLRDIARIAGVSPATVSRVLNDPAHRTASQETRDLIWKIAREHNYIPNQAARALKRGEAEAAASVPYIDVLMTRSGKRSSNPFFNELLRNVEHEVHAHEGVIVNVWYETDLADTRRHRRADVDRLLGEIAPNGNANADPDQARPQGLVVIGRCNREALKALASRYRAVVSINRSSCDFAVDEVTCDGARIAAISVDYLAGLGHRHIGYAGECVAEPRYRGFQAALTRHDLVLDPSAVVECEPSEVSAKRVLDELSRLDDPPTAVICGSDTLALGLMRRLSLQGHRYWWPSIIGCDDIEEGQFVRPMLTTVGMPKRDMAHMACNLMFDRLAGGHREPARVEVPARLMVRESCVRVSSADQIEYII